MVRGVNSKRDFAPLNSKAATLRVAFAGAAILVTLGLSFRPIPSATASNDTGRYVGNQLQACALPISGTSWVTHDSSVVLNPSLIADPSESFSLRAFDWIMRPACLGNEPRLFLFCASLALPISFLLFADWKREGTLLVACGLLISTIGFEFMTNALRQGVGLAFLLAGFAFEKRLLKISAIAVAMLLHDSNWFFAPLALLIAYKSGTLSKRRLLLWSIPMLALVGYLFTLSFFSTFDEIYGALMTYAEAYAEKPSVSFLIFMIFPLFLIFLFRYLDRQAKPSKEEQIAFLYSTALLILSLLFFPYITYRFAMAAIAIQIFMAAKSPNLSVRSGIAIAGGLVVNFMIYAIFSKSVISLFYG